MRKTSWITCPRSHNWCIQSRDLKPSGLPPDIAFLTTVLGNHMVSGCMWASMTFPDMHTALSLTSNTTPTTRSFLLKDLDWAPQNGCNQHTKISQKCPMLQKPEWNATILCCGTASWFPYIPPAMKKKQTVRIILYLLESIRISTSDELWDLVVLCKWEELERRPFLGYRVYFIQKEIQLLKYFKGLILNRMLIIW